MHTHTPLLLLILDGWGLREPVDGHEPPAHDPGDAIALARPEHYWQLMRHCPWVPVDASGLAVGLPEGQMGNSEVGHMTLGAGRIVYQDLTKIDKAIAEGDFFENPVILEAFQRVTHDQSAPKTVHLMGLLSDGGVHSSMNHLLALIALAKEQGLKPEQLRVHAFLDGRDVPPKSATPYLKTVEDALLEEGFPQIATVHGRYYAMDRDKRWERVQKSYEVITAGVSANTNQRFPFSVHALEMSYRNDVVDEFFLPAVTDFTYDGVHDGDSILFFNFRPDRARQLTRALTQADFDGFVREKTPENLYFVCMTPYDDTLPLPIAYPKRPLINTLGEVLSRHQLRQLRTAETEKYAHVTFFFNGGLETPWPGEVRKLVASPKVATYDLQPEMSLQGVTDAICEAIAGGNTEVIIANLANPDMVGHTGKLDAAIEAVKSIDAAIGRIVETLQRVNGSMLLSADHGNIECMLDAHGGPHTAHTTALVPLILLTANPSLSLKPLASEQKAYGLHHIAPTILDILNLPIPEEMSPSILQRKPVLTPTSAY
ncbi:MAG: 2,3-bisphosphoglycerate-independent phosphoglycerate mutase [Vampirovibrionales bacterium]|nr:2,3-bisphosphoglycerate-independent phosphoglycerate mutase [Vampirovibrionales bacterium]